MRYFTRLPANLTLTSAQSLGRQPDHLTGPAANFYGLPSKTYYPTKHFLLERLMSIYRNKSAYNARVSAAEMARDRPIIQHKANGDEQADSCARFALSFTKGLDHDDIGLISDPKHFAAFRQAIDDGYIDAFNNRVPVPEPEAPFDSRRQWEAPTAGLCYDLQGPDC